MKGALINEKSDSFQPLSDNLESQTYEVFEQDPVKYKQYRLVRKKELRKMEWSQLIIFSNCVKIQLKWVINRNYFETLFTWWMENVKQVKYGY